MDGESMTSACHRPCRQIKKCMTSTSLVQILYWWRKRKVMTSTSPESRFCIGGGRGKSNAFLTTEG